MSVKARKLDTRQATLLLSLLFSAEMSSLNVSAVSFQGSQSCTMRGTLQLTDATLPWLRWLMPRAPWDFPRTVSFKCTITQSPTGPHENILALELAA